MHDQESKHVRFALFFTVLQSFQSSPGINITHEFTIYLEKIEIH